MDEAPLVDFLLLADYGEVIGGKLYLMGGAWDRISVRDPEQPLRFSVALGLLVPWNATNQPHTFQITHVDADGKVLGTLVESNFVTGRPPELSPGSTQRVVVAVNALAPAPPAGQYAVVVTIDGEERRRVAFTVLNVQA